ncbi:hypothetical protein F5Y14DRAFT_40183 [Nemania sp. NC0429]|nr:hypothetical protein F5Y14DRAFT_40183 [Nemania sp. NC0429]
MATQGPANKSKPGLGRLPSRLKSFVDDMRNLRKEIYRHRRGSRSEVSRSTEPSSSEGPTPVPREDVSVPETRSLFRDSPPVRSLSIRVTVQFGEPLNYTHSQDYEGSSLLQPTEELCEALVRRVDHCSKELITRRDSSALDRTGSDGLAKPLRYEIHLQVLRNEVGTGTEAWASRTLRSYQKLPLGTEGAREVILSTHYMVGLFLRHHDEAFVWKDGPVREDPVQELKTFPYRPGRVQPLTSIPRSFFIEKQQDFESIPGYTVCFSFTSQDHHRTPPHWHETVEVNSRQLSPLTLTSAENLFLDACYAVDGVFQTQRREFEALQKSCASHSGCRHCRPHDGDGIQMLLSVKNNVGPLFDNLERTTWASVNVFWKDEATDCVEFVENAKAAIVQVCRDTDGSVSRMNDFEFYIIELRGSGWTIDEPLSFTIGPETCLCRRTVESLLDRLQTGVADVLRGNAIAVRMTARKRGHFILHKTLVAREPMETPGNKKKQGKSKEYVLDRLKQRIDRDIEMVCRDKCTIANRDVETANPDRINTARSQDYSSMKTGLLSSRRLSDTTAPSRQPTNNEPDSSTDRLASAGSELLEAPEAPGTPSSGPQYLWTRVTRDPVTGARLFPLVPARRDPHESITESRGRSVTHLDERDGTTATSFDVSTSGEQSNTSASQTTSSSSTSTTDNGSTGTSVTDPRNSGKGRHTVAVTSSSSSIQPQTPELEFSGSPSIHSSIVITPMTHEPLLNNGISVIQAPTLGAVSLKSDGSGEVDDYVRKLYSDRPTSSLAPLSLSRDDSVPSSTSRLRPVRREQDSKSLRSDDSSVQETEASSHSGGKTTGSSSIKAPGGTLHLAPVIEQDASAEQDLPRASAAKAEDDEEDFSQSKPDFNFSSPLTATSSEGGESAEDVYLSATKSSAIGNPGELRDNHESIDDDNDDGAAVAAGVKVEVVAVDSASPPRPDLSPLRHQQSKSFGSAGYLGSFNEQPRFPNMGLRRALTGSSTPPARPLSRLGFHEVETVQERPGTAR